MVKKKTVKQPKEIVQESSFVEEPVATVKESLHITFGEQCLFIKGDEEFVASIDSLDPLMVTKHSVVGGCDMSEVFEIASLDEYEILPYEATPWIANG
jgi:hypothetical protein